MPSGLMLCTSLCRSGEIGRHARFRGVWRKLCGFESRLRHYNVLDVWSCEGRSIISPYVIFDPWIFVLESILSGSAPEVKWEPSLVITKGTAFNHFPPVETFIWIQLSLEDYLCSMERSDSTQAKCGAVTPSVNSRLMVCGCWTSGTFATDVSVYLLRTVVHLC